MKYTKKILALLLALTMVFAMAVTVGADEAATGSCTITVKNAKANQTYKLYKMLDLKVDDETNPGAYSYTVNSDWSSFFGTSDAGANYVTITNDYVTWKTDAQVAEFAKAAENFASSLSSAVSTNTPTTDGDVTFNGLEAGYYLVTSSLGTKATVGTTPGTPNPEIQEKNEAPSVEKKVKENNSWDSTSYAKIGDTVEFQVTIKAKPGAENYVLYDTMSEGLTFNESSVSVKVGETEVVGANYTLKTSELSDNCTFEISFQQTYLDTITTNTDIVITYSATLNEKAKISTESNDNKVKLGYGESSFTTESKTDTYSFSFDIVKTDSSGKLLNGAEFELYDTQPNGNKINLVKNDDGSYRVATSSDTNTVTTIEAGKVTIKGLDGNTSYCLEETKAPDGYNKLAGRVAVEIEQKNLSTTMTGDTWAEGDGGVQITNNSGTELPSTGGIGTTIFYVLGSALVLAAVVLLVTKKRMGNENA